MQTVHILQITAVAGAALFFLSGLLIQRLIAGPRKLSEQRNTDDVRVGGGDEVARLHEAISQLEFELQDHRAARAEAEENVRALREILSRQGANSRSSGASSSMDGGRSPSSDQMTQMQSALETLQQQLADRQQELQDAREKMAAMQELLRTRGV